MKFQRQVIISLFCILVTVLPGKLLADAVIHQDLEEIVTADVLEIIDTTVREVEGTDIRVSVQEVLVRILSGERKGDEVTFENELTPLTAGDKVYLNRLVTIQGNEFFMYKDVDRKHSLFILLVLFVVTIVLFAGRQGIRALLSLLLSIGAIVFVLIPALLNGYDPALMALIIAGFILAIVLFGTHGINPRACIAFCGTFGAVLATCFLAWLFVYGMRFSGMSSDASMYLNFSTQGTLDFTGLLLASIIIGILGVLDDVSITQASVVQELKFANPSFHLRELYSRAIRVGNDHVGSLVNTLALAYVGASLPLVLLFAKADSSIGLTLNQEIFSVEIVRIMIGSIGLVLAVPFTTLIASWWFNSHAPKDECHRGHCHH